MTRFVMFVFLFGLLLTKTVAAQEFVLEDWEVRLTSPRSGIQCIGEGEGVALSFRPYLISRTEWSGGSLNFSWQPPRLPEKAGDGKLYGDQLVIFLSSDGMSQKEKPYALQAGITVCLDSATGDCNITAVETAVTLDLQTTGIVLNTAKGKGPIQGSHLVAIKDEDGTVSVSIDNKLVISALVPQSARKGTAWGFSNREPVGNGRNISILKRISYTP